MLGLSARLRSNSSSMAFGSLMFQGASFLTLLILKPVIPAGHFAFFITQLSLASIVGSIATLRFEILLFQERGQVDKETLLSTFLVALLVLVVCGFAVGIGARLVEISVDVSPMSLILAFGFGMIEAQSFLCVQMNRVRELVVTRGLQALALGGTALLIWSGVLQGALFTLYALGVALPLAAWFIIAIARGPGSLAIHIPSLRIWKRSIALTLAVLVNTVYANIPIVLASASQSANFVADFGFMMRLLTGPITLIRQAYGHTFLANAFRLERESHRAADDIWDLTAAAIVKSVVTYLLVLLVVIAVIYQANGFFKISHPSMIFLLSFVTIGQVGVNTVVNVRSPIKREPSFLALDVARVIVLAGCLMWLPVGHFDVTFAIVSSVLYVIYIAFIRSQVLGSGSSVQGQAQTRLTG